MIRSRLGFCFATVLILTIVGCSGGTGLDMGYVSGTVTLDGRALPKALVKFIPQGEGGMKSGSMSVGVTDDKGHYSLSYSGNHKGAVVGRHLVQITTQRHPGEDDDGNKIPGVKEFVPSEFNSNASANPDMIREVKPGKNEINFEIKSGGKVIQIPANDE